MPRFLLGLLSILVVAAALHGRALGFEFVWDDLSNVVSNPFFDAPFSRGLRVGAAAAAGGHGGAGLRVAKQRDALRELRRRRAGELHGALPRRGAAPAARAMGRGARRLLDGRRSRRRERLRAQQSRADGLALGRVDAAERALDRSLALSGQSNFRVWGHLANVHLARSDPARACRAWGRSLEINPAYDVARRNYDLFCDETRRG